MYQGEIKHASMLDDVLVLSDFEYIFKMIRSSFDRILSDYKLRMQCSWYVNGFDS